MGLSPKLIITRYFDSLVNLVDIYTEEELGKHDQAELVKALSNIYPTTSSLDDDDADDDFLFVPYHKHTFGIDSYNDPYTSSLKSSSRASETAQSGPTRVHDYLNATRAHMIERLRSAEIVSLRRCETSIATLRGLDGDDEEIKRRVFGDKFFLIFVVEKILVPYEGLVENPSPFKLYLFELDFYMDKHELTILKMHNTDYWFAGFILNGERLDKIEPSPDNRDKKNILKTDFDKAKTDLKQRVLRSFQFNEYIYSLVREAQPFCHVFRVSQGDLFGVDRIGPMRPYISFGRLELNSNDAEFSNVKSFDIVNYDTTNDLELVDLSSLNKNLMFLRAFRARLASNSLASLTLLVHLSLIRCDLQDLDADTIVNCLPNLECLILSEPRNYAHVRLTDSRSLKWLRVESIADLDSFLPNFTPPELVILQVVKSLADSHAVQCLLLTHLAAQQTLSSLRALDLFSNRLAHFDSKWLANLPHLTHLSITSCALETIDLSESSLCLESLELQNNSLSSLDSAFANLGQLKSLDLSNNRPLVLSSRVFLGLHQLERLHLRRSQLDLYLTADLFRSGPARLTDLDLADNALQHLDPDVFAPLTCLRRLRLAYNDLRRPSKDMFRCLGRLSFLDLSNNQIEFLPDRVFECLSELEVLSLASNSIEEFQEGMFQGLGSLVSLELGRLDERLLGRIDWNMLTPMPNIKNVRVKFRNEIGIQAI